MTPPKLPRMQSQTERDMAGMAAKREREAAPFEVEPEITGNYDGAELDEMRRKRPTDERIGRLEQKHDSLVRTVTDFRVDIGSRVGEMSGKLDTVLAHVTASHREQQATERVRIGSRAKVIVGVATAIGVIAGAVAAAVAGGCS
jgi:hypothetical protein